MFKQRLLRIIAFAVVLSLAMSIISTAFAEYRTIPYGEKSNAVRELQKALKSKKCYTGSVDGKFGPATKRAVQKYQRSIGLNPDGRPGNKTLTALYEGASAINTAGNPSRMVKPTNPDTLYYGCSGSRVSALQRGLKERDCYSGPIDGKYGDLTYEAVKRFQYKVGLYPDGMAGTNTIKALNRRIKNKISLSFVLELGSTGYEVRYIQKYLKARGYNCGGESGTFGKGTQQSVREWQRANGKTVNGRISKRLYNEIKKEK